MSTPTAKEGKLQIFYAVHQTGNIGPKNCNGIKETAMRPNNKYGSFSLGCPAPFHFDPMESIASHHHSTHKAHIPSDLPVEVIKYDLNMLKFFQYPLADYSCDTDKELLEWNSL